MAKTTITTYSDEIQEFIETGDVAPGDLSRAKLYCAPFRHTFSGETAGQSAALAILPKGARLLSGVLAASAPVADGDASISVGLAGRDGSGYVDSTAGTVQSYAGGTTTGPLTDSVDCFKAAAAQSTTKVEFCLTNALGYTYKLQKECWLTITISDLPATTEVLNGYILYAID